MLSDRLRLKICTKHLWRCMNLCQSKLCENCCDPLKKWKRRKKWTKYLKEALLPLHRERACFMQRSAMMDVVAPSVIKDHPSWLRRSSKSATSQIHLYKDKNLQCTVARFSLSSLNCERVCNCESEVIDFKCSWNEVLLQTCVFFFSLCWSSGCRVLLY